MLKTKINKNKQFLLHYFLIIILSVFVFGQSAEAKEITVANTVNLVNQSRQENGLNKLLLNPILNEVAKSKAAHMVENHYFAHYSPEGLDPWHWFREANYDYIYAGENLAINYKSVESQQNAWMKSTTHRKNILNPNYTETGAAIASGYIDGKVASITVQVFGTPQKALSTNVPANLQASTQKQSVVLSSYVLGQELQTSSLSTQYLTANTANSKKITEARFSFAKVIFDPIKQHSQKLIWTTILILFIVLIRDIVLKSISLPASPITHHPSMTNLIILVMLWSVFIGL